MLCGACVVWCMCCVVHVLCSACVVWCMCCVVHVLCGACVVWCMCCVVHVLLCGACVVVWCMCCVVHVLCGACVVWCMCCVVHVLCGACVIHVYVIERCRRVYFIENIDLLCPVPCHTILIFTLCPSTTISLPNCLCPFFQHVQTIYAYIHTQKRTCPKTYSTTHMPKHGHTSRMLKVPAQIWGG